MDSNIHPTAIIGTGTVIEDGVTIGPYTVIGEQVKIGRNTSIGSHAVIEFAEIGEGCHIYHHAFVGTPPQDLKFKGEPTMVKIGHNTVVRECVTINRGTKAKGETVVGNECLLMAYSHVAHDCSLGNGVIMANAATLAGHVTIGDYAVLGGLAAVHQFTRIGRLAMLGGGAMVPMDVPPFCVAQGDRACLVGLNLIGLKRRGFNSETISAIKATYRKFFFSGKTLNEATNEINSNNFNPPEIMELVKFLQESSRGFLRPRKQRTNETNE